MSSSSGLLRTRYSTQTRAQANNALSSQNQQDSANKTAEIEIQLKSATKENLNENNIQTTNLGVTENDETSSKRKRIAAKPRASKTSNENQQSNNRNIESKQAMQDEIENDKVDRNENITSGKSVESTEFIILQNVPLVPESIEKTSNPSTSSQNMLPKDPLGHSNDEPLANSSLSNPVSNEEEPRNILNDNDNYENMYGLVIEEEDDVEEEGLVEEQQSKKSKKQFPSTFDCNFCEMAYSSPIDLLRHKRHSHKYPKILVPKEQVEAYYDVEDKTKCPICTKPIKTQENFPSQHKWTLIRHLKTHMDERNYECPKCKRRFKRLDHMKEHARRHM